MRVDVGLCVSIVALSCLGCDNPVETSEPIPPITSHVLLRYGQNLVPDPPNDRPEIGFLQTPGNSQCTATLVAPRWVLTAAHCVSFLHSNYKDPASYVFWPGSGHTKGSAAYKGANILNFGPLCCDSAGSCCPSGDQSDWMKTHLHVTADISGNDDIALILLATQVPTSVVPSPATIATVVPPLQQMVRDYGMGRYGSDLCSQDDNPSTKRYVDWPFEPQGGGWETTSTIDANGNILPPSSHMDLCQNDDGHSHLCQGDSGGPATVLSPGESTDGQVWGVNSMSQTVCDEYGSVAYLSPFICGKVFAQEPHSWCQPGDAMIVPVFGCKDTTLFTDKVVTYVCGQGASENPGLSKCCDPSPAGKWDWECVQAGAAWASQQPEIGDVCGRDAWVQGPITSPGLLASVQYYPRDFSVFVLNDAIAFPDVHGSVAAGGQFTASSFFLNGTATYWTALVAGGPVTLSNGTIRGSVFSSTVPLFDFAYQMSLPNGVTLLNGASVFASPISPINFGEAFVKLRNMSQALNRYLSSPSARVTVTNGGSGLDITSSEREFNVVTVPASQLNDKRSINLTVPTGSPLLVNVTGSSDVTFRRMQINSNANILWNFPDTTTTILMTEGVFFWGSVLAPDADVRFDYGGMMFGTLVAKSASPLYTDTGASYEMHLGPFRWPIRSSAPRQTIYQIDCGTGSGVAPFGRDNYSSGGSTYTVTNTISTTGVTNPAPAAVYQTERFGAVTYELPNLMPGALYTVRLHFAELYVTASAQRKFNVTINDETVLSNLDIYATTGGRFKAMVREFTAMANSSGKIVLKFVKVVENPTIAGIELIK